MKIAIVGLGQIGGSMALKLSKKVDLSLFDVDEELCLKLNAKCERFHGTYDLVVLALHVPVILEMMEWLPRQNLYLDTASVKEVVVEEARRRGLRFVGGHPIAGNERKGSDAWDANLFKGKPFALVKVNCTDEDERTVERFVDLLAGIPKWTTAKAHDLNLAYTSHAPYFVSLAVKKAGQGHEDFAGPGYASMTRLSKQDSMLGKMFAKYNSSNVSRVLKEIATDLLNTAKELEK